MPKCVPIVLTHLEIDAHLSKEIAKNLEGKKVIPIILSHGGTCSRSLYTSHCLELASCGYMVFALDHHDGSCHYTENEKGIKVEFNADLYIQGFDCDPEVMNGMIDVRINEIKNLIDEMYDPKFID